MKTSTVSLLVILVSTFAQPQSNPRHPNPGPAAQNSLTIMVTVQSSVSLTLPDGGRPKVTIANAPYSRESFVPPIEVKQTQAALHRKNSDVVVPASSTSAAPRAAMTTARAAQSRQPAVRGADSGADSSAPVVFDLSSQPERFDVTEEVQLMEVTVDGKTQEEPVVVTTVVPR